MGIFHGEDVPEWLDKMEDEMGFLIEDDRVWETARLHEKPPNIGHIICDLILSEVVDKIKEEMKKLKIEEDKIEIEYEVMGTRSTLTLNDKSVRTYDEILDILKENKPKRNKNIKKRKTP